MRIKRMIELKTDFYRREYLCDKEWHLHLLFFVRIEQNAFRFVAVTTGSTTSIQQGVQDKRIRLWEDRIRFLI
jgi:hypothetical protein